MSKLASDNHASTISFVGTYMDDGRGCATLGARDGGAGLDSVDEEMDGLGRRVRVVRRLTKREDKDAMEDDDMSPLDLVSREEDLDEHVRARRARGLSEMTRSPEWNKLEYSTPVAQSFAINQDIIRAYERSG